jgi:rare lipoprotein A
MSYRIVGSLLVIAVCALVNGGCASARSEGLASYYADKYQGRKTANGETFDTAKLTAAHRTLPFGTRVRVTNVDNGKSVDVRINDRGPFVAGRVIDLSPAAARQLDMLRAGVVRVRLDVLGTGPVASINE